MEPIKYYADITPEEMDSEVVINCLSDDDYHTIIIKNSTQKSLKSSYNTDYLNVTINTVLTNGGKEYHCHVLKARRQDVFAEQQFDVVYHYVFSKITSPISGFEIYDLVRSLGSFFKITPDPNRKKLQIGVFGELLFIKYLYQNGYPEIIQKYHKDFYSKHDIEINSRLRMEIKTNLGEQRIHTFEHSQIHRNDVKVLVGSLLLEESSEGVSLYHLFQEIISYYSDPDTILSLRGLMIKCGLDEAGDEQGIKISEDRAIENIRIFDAADLPQIPIDSVPGVSHIRYDVDCALAQPMPMALVLVTLNFASK